MNYRADYQPRSAVDTDQRQISKLIHFSTYVHRHMDWRSPLDWINSPPFLVVERKRELIAALACPPDPPNIAWLRLFVSSDQIPVHEAWPILWKAAREELTHKGRFLVAAICLHDWFRELLTVSGFKSRQEIVMLERQGEPAGESALPSGISIRMMMPYDLPAVAEVDAAAFEPVWQNSLEALNRAYPQAMVATVAESAGRVTGYQISTRNPFGAHLARLAVQPEAQKRGVGQALVVDLIRRLAGQSIGYLTVNTQSDNPVSLVLYKKTGFRETGERYPVYEFLLE